MHINHHDLVCWLAGKVLLCVSFQPTILKITTTSHHLQQHFWKRKGWSWLLCAVVVTLTSPHLNDQVRRGLFYVKRSKSGLPTNDRMNHALGCCPLNCFFLQVFFYFFYFFKEVTAWVCPGPQGIVSRPLTKWGGVFSMQNDHSPGCPRTIEWIMPRVIVPWIVFSYKLFFLGYSLGLPRTWKIQPGSAQDPTNIRLESSCRDPSRCID